MENEPWITEILLGRPPARTKAYQEKLKRREIIDLFIKIHRVNAIFPSKEEQRKALLDFMKNDLMIAKLRQTLEFCYEARKKKPVSIIYLKNDKWKIEIEPNEQKSRIYVRLPVILEDW